jgi:cysteine desulfurase
MLANNETGTLQPVREIGALCKERGVLFHSDAVQGLAHLPCDVEALGIDLLSISAHKLYGPKGAGALYVRRRRPRARLEPIIDGGGHERGLRSGTLNVPGIVGLGKACELARLEREGDAERLRRLRDRLRERLLRELPGAIVNGSWEHRLPNNLNISLPGLESERLIASMPEVAVSSGAACTSASFDSSYVLRCLGQPDAVVRSSLRFGLGRFTTEAEIERAADLTIGAVLRLRGNAAPLADNSVCGGR